MADNGKNTSKGRGRGRGRGRGGGRGRGRGGATQQSRQQQSRQQHTTDNSSQYAEDHPVGGNNRRHRQPTIPDDRKQPTMPQTSTSTSMHTQPSTQHVPSLHSSQPQASNPSLTTTGAGPGTNNSTRPGTSTGTFTGASTGTTTGTPMGTDTQRVKSASKTSGGNYQDNSTTKEFPLPTSDQTRPETPKIAHHTLSLLTPPASVKGLGSPDSKSPSPFSPGSHSDEQSVGGLYTPTSLRSADNSPKPPVARIKPNGNM